MARTYAPIVEPNGDCSPYELLLRIAALAVATYVLEAMGEENVGWNTQTVRLLEKRFDDFRDLPTLHPPFGTAACIGDLARVYLGGDWVFAEEFDASTASEEPPPGDVMVRLQTLPDNVLGRALPPPPPEGTLFDPFQAANDWFEGSIPSPFTPLYAIVGLPPDLPLVPLQSHIHKTLPVMRLPAKKAKAQKKRK